jgi:hypothetical protein
LDGRNIAAGVEQTLASTKKLIPPTQLRI